MSVPDTVVLMFPNDLPKGELPADLLEERLKAHVRARMQSRGIGPQGLADLTGIDQGYFSKWLPSPRGKGSISAKYAYRLMKRLDLGADELWNTNPAADFWRPYTPYADRTRRRESPAKASTATAHPSRRTRGGGA